MQLRCTKCHRPFALSKEMLRAALDFVVAEDLNHYDVPCPHCKRVNRVSREALERAAPPVKEQEADSDEKAANEG